MEVLGLAIGQGVVSMRRAATLLDLSVDDLVRPSGALALDAILVTRPPTPQPMRRRRPNSPGTVRGAPPPARGRAIARRRGGWA